MLTLAVLVLLTWVPVSLSCNKALCASDVSKCLIQVGLRVLLVSIKIYCGADIERRYTHVEYVSNMV